MPRPTKTSKPPAVLPAKQNAATPEEKQPAPFPKAGPPRPQQQTAEPFPKSEADAKKAAVADAPEAEDPNPFKRETTPKAEGGNGEKKVQDVRGFPRSENVSMVQVSDSSIAPPVTPKDDSIITSERVLIYKRTRFNPIRGLNPQLLSLQIDSFNAGTLRDFARTQEEIAKRDSRLKTVMPKRCGALKRRQWEIVENPHADCSPETKENHKKALRYFYDRLVVTDAVEKNQVGDISLLQEQMIRGAVGNRYSVHEILWKPTSEGLTATLNHVPLWFFENHMGRLRFLLQDFAWDGIDLDKGGWMIAVGDHLMLPCSVCWMFKRLSFNDWTLYNERYGIPARVGQTDAAIGSKRWANMREVVANLGNDFAGVINTTEKLEPFNFAATGEPPMPKLVDYLDREITAAWRGGDLSTASANDSQGASLQGEESYILETSDAELINSNLNKSIDRAVIGWAFGEGVQPAANFKIIVPPPRNIAIEIQTDTFLLGLKKKGAVDPETGEKAEDSVVGLSAEEVYERYGRSMPDPEDEVLTTGGQPAPGGMPGGFPGAPQFGPDGKPIQPGQDPNAPLLDEEGEPVLDEDGKPVFAKDAFSKPGEGPKDPVEEAGGGKAPPFGFKGRKSPPRAVSGPVKLPVRPPFGGRKPPFGGGKKPLPPWLRKKQATAADAGDDKGAFSNASFVNAADVQEQLTGWMAAHKDDADALAEVRSLREQIRGGQEPIGVPAMEFANESPEFVDGAAVAVALALEGYDEIPVTFQGRIRPKDLAPSSDQHSAVNDAEFEAKHERDKDGKFASNGGGFSGDLKPISDEHAVDSLDVAPGTKFPSFPKPGDKDYDERLAEITSTEKAGRLKMRDLVHRAIQNPEGAHPKVLSDTLDHLGYSKPGEKFVEAIRAYVDTKDSERKPAAAKLLKTIDNSETAQAMVRVEQELLQRKHPEGFITLYRGIYLKPDTKWNGKFRPVSSWSDRKKAAASFGLNENLDGIVIQMRVPIKNIIASHLSYGQGRSGVFAEGQNEYLVRDLPKFKPTKDTRVWSVSFKNSEYNPGSFEDILDRVQVHGERAGKYATRHIANEAEFDTAWEEPNDIDFANAAEFDEGEHPRDRSGKFASKGEGESAAKAGPVTSKGKPQHVDLSAATELAAKSLGMKPEALRSALSGKADPSNAKVNAMRCKVTDALLKQNVAVKDAVFDALKLDNPAAKSALIASMTHGNIEEAVKQFAATPTFDLALLGGINVKSGKISGDGNCVLSTRVITMGTGSMTGTYRHEMGHAMHAAWGMDSEKNEMTKILHDHYASVKEKMKAEPAGVKQKLDHEWYETHYGIMGARAMDNAHENFAEHYRGYAKAVYQDIHEGGNGKNLAQYRERHPEMARLFDAHYTVALMSKPESVLVGLKKSAQPKAPAGEKPVASPAPTKPGKLPAQPTFASGNAEQVKANQKALDEMKALALGGDAKALAAHAGTPSPKVQQYKQQLLDHLKAAEPKTEKVKFALKGVAPPVPPSFDTSNPKQLADNLKAISELKKLADAGDLSALEKHEGTPSPKVQAYKAALIAHAKSKTK